MKTTEYGGLLKPSADNIYYPSAHSNLETPDKTVQTVQFKQIILFAGELIAVASLFGLLFAGLWIGCALDDGCWQSYAGAN
jgi:hypothetical protein